MYDMGCAHPPACRPGRTLRRLTMGGFLTFVANPRSRAPEDLEQMPMTCGATAAVASGRLTAPRGGA